MRGGGRPAARLDAVLPVLIPLVADIANFEQIIARLLEAMSQHGIGVVAVVVAGGERHTRGCP